MKDTIDINLEEAAAEAKEDRENLARLKADHRELVKREDIQRLGDEVKRLIDAGISPAIVAKTMLIGDRPGSALYQFSVMTPALDASEVAACLCISRATRDADPVMAATMLVAGAVWLAEQSGITRDDLVDVIGSDLARRPMRRDRLGAGAIDLVDNDGLGNREWLVDAINKARLPSFAPLELDRKAVRR
jgi:hypothetical protein